MKRRDGFTLVEILVVIAIIGFLVSTIVVVATFMKERAMMQATSARLEYLRLGLSNYYREFNHYPHGGVYVDGSSLTALDGTGSLYVLWLGVGRSRIAPYEWGVQHAPQPGMIKNAQGKLIQCLEEKDLQAFSDSAERKWVVDGWRRPIVYGIWRPAPKEPYDPYFVLTSAGNDGVFGTVDDIVAKGTDR